MMAMEVPTAMAWFEILRHAPALLSAAETLIRRSKSGRASDQTRSIELRIDELAESSRASAELMQDIAKQLAALASAHDDMVRKVRTATGISVAAAVIAVAAIVIAFVR